MINALKKQQGFSLIEVLISVLVLGVGLLGLGGLQVAAVKGSSNAHYRTVASMLAIDLGDRMKANPAGVALGYYDDYNNIACNAAFRRCRNTTCTSLELSQFDILEVKCGIKRGTKRNGGVLNSLPSGTFAVTCVNDCTLTKEPHDIAIGWDNRIIDDEQKQNTNADSDNTKSNLIISIIP